MRLCLAFALAASLTACTTGSYWLYPPGGDEAQWHRDVYECTQEAQQYSSSAYVNPYGGAAQGGTGTNYDLRNACLRARGYREGAGQNSSSSAAPSASLIAVPTMEACLQDDSWRGDQQISQAYCMCVESQLPNSSATMHKVQLQTLQGVCLNEKEDMGRTSFIEKYGPKK
jgi:hypothetical protein